MKIVVLDGFTLNPGDLSWEDMASLGTFECFDRTSRDELIERAKDAEILITNKTPINRTTLSQLPKLRYIGVLATGYNIVDVAAAKKLGVIVTNVPTYGTKSVAQFVFAHLLEICHHVSEHSQSVKAGKWNRTEDFCYWDRPLIELDGKVMGIIGTGRIGLETARIASAFGMKVIAYAPRPKREQMDGLFEYVSLETLLMTSDVISLHCPLTDETRGLLNDAAFEKMKTGVIIINTSRGPLIDEDALTRALKSGKVYAAGLDVMTYEPPKGPSQLFEIENCQITPHIAWAPIEARQRLLNTATQNVKAFIEGDPINVVSGN
jgi:glycerate dehydrogenase